MNCPNCSAPLPAGAYPGRTVVCAYCHSSVVPAIKGDAERRIADAAERSASELALQRLHREARHAREMLQRESSSRDREHLLAWEDENELIRRAFAVREGRASLNVNRVEKIRAALFNLTFVLPILVWVWDNMWSFGQWVRGWVAFGILLVLTLAAQVVLSAARSAQASLSPPAQRPLPPREVTKEERRLAAKRGEIDAEIARHRKVVNGQKPGA